MRMLMLAYLSGLQADGVQGAVVVLYLDGPGLAVVVVVVRNVHDGGDHVCPRLVLLPIEYGTVEWRGRGKGREEKRAEVGEENGENINRKSKCTTLI
jgi:hypothetical protein